MRANEAGEMYDGAEVVWQESFLFFLSLPTVLACSMRPLWFNEASVVQ
jgi:hypothetical protein